ncbi:hypothetical protein N8552_01065 [bacterium]|nr:hypothetical protein [bacterium]
MKEFVLLFGAFALIGCGENKKSTDTAEGSQDAGPIPVAEEEVKAASSGPEPLISDADVERFAKDALYIGNTSPPIDYTGWTKDYFDKAGTQLAELAQMKNGKPDGPTMLWYPTGKIKDMSMWKSGEMVSRQAFYPTGEKQMVISSNEAGLQEGVSWHKNGRKAAEGLIGDEGPLMKDGQLLMKFWNDEGGELDQEEGMKMMERLMD